MKKKNPKEIQSNNITLHYYDEQAETMKTTTFINPDSLDPSVTEEERQIIAQKYWWALGQKAAIDKMEEERKIIPPIPAHLQRVLSGDNLTEGERRAMTMKLEMSEIEKQQFMQTLASLRQTYTKEGLLAQLNEIHDNRGKIRIIESKIKAIDDEKINFPEIAEFRQFANDELEKIKRLVDPLYAEKQAGWIDEIKQPHDLDTSPKDLKSLFINEDAYNLAIEALKHIPNPVVDENMNYLLGKHQKSAFTAWISVLVDRGLVKATAAKTWAGLLNEKISGLNLAKDGKTLRTPKKTVSRTTAYNKYKNAFLKEISS